MARLDFAYYYPLWCVAPQMGKKSPMRCTACFCTAAVQCSSVGAIHHSIDPSSISPWCASFSEEEEDVESLRYEGGQGLVWHTIVFFSALHKCGRSGLVCHL